MADTNIDRVCKNTNSNIKKEIPKLYKNQKITIYEISKRARISGGKLYEYVSGKRNKKRMTAETLKKLAVALEISMDELYDAMIKYT